MSATSHGGAQPSALSAAGWQVVGLGAMALLHESRWDGVHVQEVEGAADAGQVRAGGLQVPGGSIERPVSEQQLHGACVDPRFEQMRRKRVAQSMNACAMGDGGRPLRMGVNPLGRAAGHRLGEGLPWKEPPRRPVQLPRGPQCGQQAGRQEGRAVFAPFALIDAHQPPVTLDVRPLQMDDLTDPQTSRRLNRATLRQR